MSHTQNQNRSGANSQRRRNRSNNNRRPSGTGHSGPSAHTSSGKPHAPKKTLVQKLLGLVGLGGKKKAPARTAASARQTPRDQGTTKVTRTSNPRQSRKPENVEVTNPRLYIGNLSYDATEGDLQEVFNGVGRVVSVEIVTNSRTQRSKGYGFVEMGSIEEAKRAVEVLHDQEYMNRKMVVSGAKPKDESGDRE
jgi:hypothetical protein